MEIILYTRALKNIITYSRRLRRAAGPLYKFIDRLGKSGWQERRRNEEMEQTINYYPMPTVSYLY